MKLRAPDAPELEVLEPGFVLREEARDDHVLLGIAEGVGAALAGPGVSVGRRTMHLVARSGCVRSGSYGLA